MRILVVEDDPLLSHHLKVQLGELGNQVQVAGTAKEGFFQATNYPIDVAIVDLGLPDQDGIALIQRLRDEDVKAPILILTARVNWQDKVEGLTPAPMTTWSNLFKKRNWWPVLMPWSAAVPVSSSR